MSKAKNLLSNKKHLSEAKKVLKEEIKALQLVSNTLDARFEKFCDALLCLEPTARIICTGVGKAGIIAQKCSATLSSIGCPSFFLHPNEALHGDLGKILPSDALLFFSNSGDSPEIKDLLPHLKRIGCLLLAITSSTESTLAKNAEHVISYGKIKEAGTLSIAPTTSTLVMLALADAISMCLLKSKGLNREQFVRYHPGGKLGRRLIPIHEIMRSGLELCCCEQTLAVREVLAKITSTKGRPGAAAIIDKKGKLCGIFTDGVLRRCLTTEEKFLERPVSLVMGKNPKFILSDASAEQALALLQRYSIDQIVVVNKHHEPIGMVDIQDVS